MPDTRLQDVFAAELDTPYPRRYYWLIRFIALGLLWVLLVAAVRVGWSVHAWWRFEHALAQIEASGLLAEPDDEPSEPLPDDQNAAIVYRKLAAQITTIRPSDGTDVLIKYYDTDDEIYLHEIADLNSGVLQEVRRARSMRCAAPHGALTLVRFSNARMLARTISYAALREFAAGETFEGVEFIVDGLHHVQTVWNDGYVISGLVAEACEALMLQVLERHAEQVIASLQGDHSALVRQRCRSLIDLLLTESSMDEAYIAAYRSEVEFIRERTNARPAIQQTGWRRIQEPQIVSRYADYIPMLHHGLEDRLAGRIPQEDYRIRFLPSNNRDEPTTFLRVLEEEWFPSGQIGLTLGWDSQRRALAERRLTATGLALWLYRADHGEWPAQLSELVPDYLPAPLVDPLAEGKTGFKAIFHDGPSRIYSVGRNGKDDGGLKHYRGEKADIIFYLMGVPEELAR